MHPLRYQAPEDKEGYDLVLGRDLELATWLSVYGSGKQQIPATTFVKYILQSAEKEYNVVCRKALDIVKVERARGPPKAGGFREVCRQPLHKSRKQRGRV